MGHVGRQRVRSLLIGLAALAYQSVATAAFTSIVTFGDSLSDTGNLFLASGGAQPPAGQPYFNGRFSDGPLWIEALATGLGRSADASPFLAGGRNYAFAGARTGTSTPPPGVLGQIGGLWSQPVADPDALYVIWGGMNDMRDARSAFRTASASDAAGRQAAAQAAIDNLYASLGFLASIGARHFLIANLPNLGDTPEAALLDLQFASSDASARFNALIPGLETFVEASLGLDIDVLDIASLFAAIRTDALSNGGAVYGITNVTSPCAGFIGSSGAPCNASLFSDALHPSAQAHALIGRTALGLVQDVQQAPEPGTVALLGLGLAGLAASRHRKQ